MKTWPISKIRFSIPFNMGCAYCRSRYGSVHLLPIGNQSECKNNHGSRHLKVGLCQNEFSQYCFHFFTHPRGKSLPKIMYETWGILQVFFVKMGLDLAKGWPRLMSGRAKLYSYNEWPFGTLFYIWSKIVQISVPVEHDSSLYMCIQ